MSNFVLVTGFGTGRRTARRVGDTIERHRDGEYRVFTYGEAEASRRDFRRAVEGADETYGHSQGSDTLLRARPARATLIAPPIADGRMATAMRLPLGAADIAQHLFEQNRLEIFASGLGEMMLRGPLHSMTFLRGSLGPKMLHNITIAHESGTDITVAQMEGDRIIPVVADKHVDGLRRIVLQGTHNSLLEDPEKVLSQLPVAA